MCVDDNPDVIEAVRILIAARSGLEWVGSMLDAHDLLRVVQARRPDVVLLDIDMPGPDPFTVTAQLAARCPDARVIILSGHVRKDLVNRAVEAGAWGYVAKSDGEQAILRGIEQVAAGEFVMSQEVRGDYAL